MGHVVFLTLPRKSYREEKNESWYLNIGAHSLRSEVARVLLIGFHSCQSVGSEFGGIDCSGGEQLGCIVLVHFPEKI